jgi:CheY-like chemotaxis protein
MERPNDARDDGGEHILVVDDDPVIARLTSLKLRSSGYDVHALLNGEDAVAYIELGTPRVDLVIMDVHMPKMGGVEAVQRIRELEPSLPVIFSTGLGDSRVGLVAADDPSIDHIEKPYPYDQLLQRIRVLLDATRHPTRTGS